MKAYAAEKTYVAAAKGVIAKLNDAIIFPLITLGMAAAALVFIWGVFTFVRGDKGGPSYEQGKRTMLYGLIGLFVMVSARAILSIAAGTVGVSLPR